MRRAAVQGGYWPLLTMLGPIGFGSTYWVTHAFLPVAFPLWGSTLRALPAGIVLMLLVRRLPQGRQWWQAIVLGVINVGLFFVLAYLAAQLLPTTIAASIAAAGPLVLALFAWILLGERTSRALIVTSVLGAVGVLLVVGATSAGLRWSGIAASLGMLVLMSLGAILNRRWMADTPVLTATAWQLLSGGVTLFIAAVVREGSPPHLSAASVMAIAYLSLFATAFAYFCWFSGFQHLPATIVGILGLLTPVTGVILGVVLGGEPFTLLQVGGMLLVIGSVGLSQCFGKPSGKRPDG